MFYIPFLTLIFNAYESNAVISKVVKKKKKWGLAALVFYCPSPGFLVEETVLMAVMENEPASWF